MDTIGPFTRSKKGNAYAIVIQELSTKFIEIFPVRNQTGKIVVKSLDQVFDKWGTPRSIVTDDGTEYINKDVKSFLSARNVSHITTPLAHPQANPVERVNRTIKPMIAAFISDKHNEWDQNLSKIQLAYNTVPHAGSRISPFYLNHGREAVIKNVTQCTGDNEPVMHDEMVQDWVKRIDKITDLRHQVEQRLQSYSSKRLARINSDKPNQVEIKIGTEVYYPNKKLSKKSDGYSSKLDHRFLGPATVRKMYGSMVAELIDKNNKIVGKYRV